MVSPLAIFIKSILPLCEETCPPWYKWAQPVFWAKRTAMRTLLFLCSLSLWLGCQPSPTGGIPGLKHVIVIGVDGMSPDGIRQAPTPHLDRLMAEGASTLRARAVLPTSSSPNWASMIMGAGPELHGITSNAWEVDQHTLPPAVAGGEGRFPTIFSVLRAQRPAAEIGAIYHWEGFGRLYQKAALSHDEHQASEALTTEAALAYLTEQRPLFTFIHLDHVDHAGHHDGHGSAAYYASVARADSLIGRILAALQDEGMAEQSLVLVTADHGGIGYGHGGETPEEIEIPFILWGRGVKAGYAIGRQVMTYDNAPTLAWALGLERPAAWTGRPVLSAFTGQPDDAGAYLAFPYQPRPAISPAGGLFDTLPAIRLTHRGEAGTLRYTLDGSQPGPESPAYHEPLGLSGPGVVRAAIFQDSLQLSPESQASFRLRPVGAGYGVRYQVWLGEALSRLPEGDRWGTPVARGVTAEFDLAGVDLPRPEQVVVRFEAALTVAEAGTYQFFLASDDGSRLYVNGQLVVDNDGDHGVIERSGKIDLAAGVQSLRLDWFNGGGGGEVSLAYAGPGLPRQVVPAGRLRLPE